MGALANIHCIYDFVKCPAHTKCSRAAQKLSAGHMRPGVPEFGPR